MWDEFWTDRGAPWCSTTSARPGRASGAAVRKHARLPRPRRRGAGKGGVPLALRPDVLPRAARAGAGARAGGGPGGRAGRVARAPLLHRWHRRTAAAPVALDRHHALLPGLNTFVYPIFGQYDDELRRLDAEPRPKIVQHRHEVFELAARTHPLDLCDLRREWLPARASIPEGECAAALSPRARARSTSFTTRSRRCARASPVRSSRSQAWAAAHDSWLSPDPDGRRRFDEGFVFGAAPVPFADLPFGAPWAGPGRGGTSSNRKDNQKVDPALLGRRRVRQPRCQPLLPGERRRLGRGLRRGGGGPSLPAAPPALRRLRPDRRAGGGVGAALSWGG